MTGDDLNARFDAHRDTLIAATTAALGGHIPDMVAMIRDLPGDAVYEYALAVTGAYVAILSAFAATVGMPADEMVQRYALYFAVREQ